MWGEKKENVSCVKVRAEGDRFPRLEGVPVTFYAEREKEAEGATTQNPSPQNPERSYTGQ